MEPILEYADYINILHGLAGICSGMIMAWVLLDW